MDEEKELQLVKNKVEKLINTNYEVPIIESENEEDITKATYNTVKYYKRLGTLKFMKGHSGVKCDKELLNKIDEVLCNAVVPEGLDKMIHDKLVIKYERDLFRKLQKIMMELLM